MVLRSLSGQGDPDERVRTFRPQARAILQVIFDGYGESARDSEIIAIPVIPKSVTIHRNSYKQADSFDMVFEAGDLPMDPALIRAGAAEIFLFQVSGSGDTRRVLSRREPLASADPGAVRPRDPIDTIGLGLGTDASRDSFTLGYKPQIVGLFDDTDIELSESGKWVSLKGQDYTAYLAATQFPPNADGTARRIPTGKRLDLLVDDLLGEADPDGQLAVAVRGIEPGALPIVGSQVSANARGIPVEQGTSYWDVIYKIVERCGFIVFVDGLDVVISRPKTITDRDVPNIKRMAWGKNLEHLTMRRHLGKEQAPTIVVRSYVQGKGTLTAEYPEGQIDRSTTVVSRTGSQKLKFKRRVKERTSTSKKGKVKTTVRERDEYQIVTVHGISDPAALKRIAENRYHLLGKAERTVVARTRDLRDLRDLDLLTITAGDAFLIEWDEFNRELLSNPAIAMNAKIRHLVDKGFNVAVANEIAKRFEMLQGLARPLRLRECTLEYDADNGVSIEMELQDFVVVDGIRSGSGATRQPTLDKRRDSLTKAGGKPVGWSPEQQRAQQRRFDK